MAGLLDLLAPPRCASCGAPGHLPWCDRCRDEARRLQARGRCRRCAGDCTPRDPACPLRSVGVARTWAAFVYTGVVARTVVAAKVGRHHAAWVPLGRHLGQVVATGGPDVDVVVPVATEPTRARRRGFDHARVLGREVAAALGVPAVPALGMRRGAPDRGVAGHDDDLGDGTIRASVDRLPARVLLVDDVLTSGATVRACARALRGVGVEELHVAVLARARR